MRKIRSFVLHDSQILSNADMENLSGGIARGTAICKKGYGCTFYSPEIKNTVVGTCYEYSTPSSFHCYCQGHILRGASSDCFYSL